MCFILTAIKLNEDNIVKQAIVDVLASKQEGNSHGSAGLFFNTQGKPVISRDMRMGINEMKTSLDQFNIVSYHFRLATVGDKNIKNVHYWKIGNWAFCHNGVISGIGNDTESDSLVFFKDLVKKNYLTKDNKVKGQKIKDYTNQQAFFGRYIIVNLKTKNMYFFGDFEVYLLNRNYIVLTSIGVDFEANISVMGLDFATVDNEIEKVEGSIDGVWVFEHATQTFKMIFDTFKEWNYGNNNTTWDKKTQTWVKNPIATEESDNVGTKEVMIVKNDRTEESYRKEFFGRLKSTMQTDPYLEMAIDEEIAMGQVNEFGRTDTEDVYWEMWIAPQLEASGKKDFTLRDVSELLNM